MIHYPLNTLGIFTAIGLQAYDEAIKTFIEALSYESEPYSKYVIQLNMMMCYLKLGETRKAEECLRETTRIATMPENCTIKEFQLFQHMCKGFFHFYLGENKDCLHELVCATKMDNVEPRYRFIIQYLYNCARTRLNYRIKKNVITPCKPVLVNFMEEQVFFLTLRFFE